MNLLTEQDSKKITKLAMIRNIITLRNGQSGKVKKKFKRAVIEKI